ncbi:MAG: cupin domain-containing protein [Comamonadaceae bacterium]|nr:cupin domain-containing protein [Burkholderiales bacterium]MEB2348617.1 cupin domain-containing protein [Comamonadaceae bacterium]
MDVDQALPLLGGLSAAQFMRRHWHKKPLLVRQAIAGHAPPLSRAGVFALAGDDAVESRLVERRAGRWHLRHGPFQRRALPPLSAREWTLLVQGVDLHSEAAHALLQRFAFVPHARLDDVMVSFATDGGGVGPHFDSYDVFLLQAQGRRRWRIGRQKDLTLQDDLPLKILAHFEPEAQYVLEPGDMLYLPPRWAHDGIAEGECMTVSIGFRSPTRAQLAHEVLVRVAEVTAQEGDAALYRDPAQPAVARPGAIPQPLQAFARDAVRRALAHPDAIACALGEVLTEPKPQVWFTPGAGGMLERVVLDRRTRMVYDERHVYINGASWRASGRDATLLRRLADTRELTPAELARASDTALELLGSWCDAGWAHGVQPGDGGTRG